MCLNLQCDTRAAVDGTLSQIPVFLPLIFTLESRSHKMLPVNCTSCHLFTCKVWSCYVQRFMTPRSRSCNVFLINASPEPLDIAVKGNKVGICDGVPSTAALLSHCFTPTLIWHLIVWSSFSFISVFDPGLGLIFHWLILISVWCHFAWPWHWFDISLFDPPLVLDHIVWPWPWFDIALFDPPLGLYYRFWPWHWFDISLLYPPLVLYYSFWPWPWFDISLLNPP